MQQPSELSLSRRAILALTLWAGFYLLSLGLVGGLCYAAYALFTWTRSPSFLEVLCGIAAGFGAIRILWSIFPRWKKFKPPGPKLDPSRHRRLFDEIRRVAKETRQKPPSEVYLDSGVNAWVSSRGGLLGLFGRRVMAIGLPLLNVITQGQLRCIVAHEFGHYAGGDTFLGSWVYRTHAAIQRTLEMLEGNDSLWRFPFQAYGKLFQRVSLAVSQQQELAADALAARIGGGRKFGETLSLLEGAGDAFPGFINEELLPALNAGFRPPFSEGFQRYLKSQEVSRYVRRMVHRELAVRKLDPYRTHPPLSVRLAALAQLSPGVAPAVDHPAIDLLTDRDALEIEVLTFFTENPRIRTLPVLTWDDLGEKAFLPMWRKREEEIRPKVQGLRPEDLPTLNLTELGRRLQKDGTDWEVRSVAMTAVGTAFAVGLRDRGWTIGMEPGERPSLTRGEVRVEPFHVFIDLAEGKLTAEAWRERCRTAGLEGMTLGAAAPTP